MPRSFHAIARFLLLIQSLLQFLRQQFLHCISSLSLFPFSVGSASLISTQFPFSELMAYPGHISFVHDRNLCILWPYHCSLSYIQELRTDIQAPQALISVHISLLHSSKFAGLSLSLFNPRSLHTQQLSISMYLRPFFCR